jgi:glyceraldehyde-3-phosphate dehydrogenase/erythrose-4-phosphate dehydrogenase
MNNVQAETTGPQDATSVSVAEMSDRDLVAWKDLTHDLLVEADMAYLTAQNKRTLLATQHQEALAEIRRRQQQ